MLKSKIIVGQNGKIPTKGDINAAGYDLYSAEDVVIYPNERKLIKTDIKFIIPTGYYGRISDRSGLAYKSGITVIAGIIDSSYRGEIGVILYNSDKDNKFPILKGDRIAQIVIETHFDLEFEQVDGFEDKTERGENGFGSTGVK